MLELKNIIYRYPEAEIRTGFTLARGESAALMGPSGAGKTTILNLIAGFLHPDQGDIRFGEQSLLGIKPASRPLTFLFQAHNLFPHLTVWQNLAIGIDPGLHLSDSQKESISQALEWVSLSGFDQRAPMDLSGGQQQRVALARCLIRDRPMLLLDEPFSAFDQTLRNEMISLIKQLQSQQNLTLVFATHQLPDAQAMGASVIEIK